MGEQAESPAKQEMESIVGQYPAQKRYLLAMMQDLQKRYRYLPEEAIQTAAVYLQLPLSAVYSMATFYKAFSLVPKGRIVLKVCDGTACHLKGSQPLIGEIRDLLGIEPGETTPDREFSLETVNCLGACAIAPAVVAGGRVYSKVNASKLRQIIADYREGVGADAS
jgi:NADH-quinone oxidoreductase subunit E